MKMKETCDTLEINGINTHAADDARRRDQIYLDKWTFILGTEGSRVVWALHVAGHTEIDEFTADEWHAFSTGYGRVIGELKEREASLPCERANGVYH